MMTPEAAQYRSLFENSLVSMLLINLESGSIMRANPAAEKFYGFGPGQMVDLAVSEIETMDPAEVGKLMTIQRENPHETALVRRHRRADGSVRDVEVRIGPMPDLPGRVAYVIITDVTAREAAMRELDEHRLRLEALLEERGSREG